MTDRKSILCYKDEIHNYKHYFRKQNGHWLSFRLCVLSCKGKSKQELADMAHWKIGSLDTLLEIAMNS